MALKGTLKDFGIADILQLIGQQQKTGVLYVTSKAEQVEISFVTGHVVRALSKTRQRRELLGTMLVRAGLLTEKELEAALDVQRRTLKRLGDILVAEGHVSAAELSEMAALQTTETLYKLFQWKAGSYEFVQQDVEHDPLQGAPIRPEAVLMEGFRRLDEWPLVRRTITSMTLTFERARPLEAPTLEHDADGDDVDAALDAALEGASAPSGDGAPSSIGRAERLVYRLADPEMSVQRLCDLSRLGEFETCKALHSLVEAGYLRPLPPRRGAAGEEDEERRRTLDLSLVLRRGAVQTALGICSVLLVVVAIQTLGPTPPRVVGVVPVNLSAARLVEVDTTRARLGSALEQYRLARGRYPERLEQLVEQDLVDASDLSRPFDVPFHYRAAGDGYVLLPPLN